LTSRVSRGGDARPMTAAFSLKGFEFVRLADRKPTIIGHPAIQRCSSQRAGRHKIRYLVAGIPVLRHGVVSVLPKADSFS
jgi:hypothetical protein